MGYRSGSARRRPTAPRTVSSQLRRTIGDSSRWAADLAQARHRLGAQLDGSWVRRTDEGPPDDMASCPNHAGTLTRWRGPLAQVGDPPMVGGAVSEVRMNESRALAAVRLYRLADRYADGPCPMTDDYRIWQAAPCTECMEVVMDRWLDATWPPPKERSTGAKSEGDGDWEL